MGFSSSSGWASDHGEPRSAWWSAGILRFFCIGLPCGCYGFRVLLVGPCASQSVPDSFFSSVFWFCERMYYKFRVFSGSIPAVFSGSIPAVFSGSIPAVFSGSIPAVFSGSIPAVFSGSIPVGFFRVAPCGFSSLSFAYW